MTINQSETHFQPLMHMLLAISRQEQEASNTACTLANKVLKQCELKIEKYKQQQDKEKLMQCHIGKDKDT